MSKNEKLTIEIEPREDFPTHLQEALILMDYSDIKSEPSYETWWGLYDHENKIWRVNCGDGEDWVDLDNDHVVGWVPMPELAITVE